MCILSGQFLQISFKERILGRMQVVKLPVRVASLRVASGSNLYLIVLSARCEMGVKR